MMNWQLKIKIKSWVQGVQASNDNLAPLNKEIKEWTGMNSSHLIIYSLKNSWAIHVKTAGYFPDIFSGFNLFIMTKFSCQLIFIEKSLSSLERKLLSNEPSEE